MAERKKIKVSILIPVYNVSQFLDRSLGSIPVRDDIEVIVLDDCSTDDSLDKVKQFWSESDLNMRVLRHTSNQGISQTMNDLYEYATGEYIYQLDPDDYLFTEEWLKAYEQLDGTDMVFVDAKCLNGEYYDKHSESNHNRCAAWFYFLRREYLGNARRVYNAYGGDYEMYLYLIGKPHTSKFTKLCAYFYNFPREGSVIWKLTHGEK